ncbi:MAG: hypothetical protein JSR21_03830 [Proteobacteria bacterium]|nr:hypothetical protein [Pseudomonadota bacterium]
MKARLAALAAGALLLGAAGPTYTWLSLCAKCLSPTVIQSSGFGTAHSTAVAKITKQGAEDWCANWDPDNKKCVAEALASDDAKTTYTATADCLAGTIKAIDGDTYRFAGIWKSGIGRGRTQWRGPDGKVLGDDNASNGLGIAQQWEVLCPGPPGKAAAGVAPAAAGKPAPLQASPQAPVRPGVPLGADSAGGFAVGDTIEARYGRDWVRGHITKIWRHEGPSGNGIGYDVRLDNGKRGIVPASMIRLVQP